MNTSFIIGPRGFDLNRSTRRDTTTSVVNFHMKISVLTNFLRFYGGFQ